MIYRYFAVPRFAVGMSQDRGTAKGVDIGKATVSTQSNANRTTPDKIFRFKNGTEIIRMLLSVFKIVVIPYKIK